MNRGSCFRLDPSALSPRDRRVGRLRGETPMLSLSEEDADAKLLALISAGLETEVDLDNLRLKT